MNRQQAITYYDNRGNEYMALANRIKAERAVKELLRRKASHNWQLSALIERMSDEQWNAVVEHEAGLPNAVATA